ncbi:HAD family hydrolase [Paenibacillus ginsengarvi]|uniref:HAD family hydrolase n=1 Tax=Paenibacillus ginsengarvi TaxID=400777 RepID=A0A3B0AZQ0_9BACL|nr:HAD family hydrolase [Paenibacillus ginsengarvi]RKN66025.1 HAD family hydrolase [Paenibacillus ginsengarvi]
MFKAVFLDFYGTLVQEDEVFLQRICSRISESSSLRTASGEIGTYWSACFARTCRSSFGEHFNTQREIELASLKDTLHHFQSSESPDQLSEILYAYWEAPALCEDTRPFLDRLKKPRIVVSNIDRKDVQSAIRHHSLPLEDVITSEDARAYKPRPEMFHMALETFNLRPGEVLHVGDSLSSDIAGAQSVGIKSAWINRNNRKAPSHYSPDFMVQSLTDLIPLLE